MNLLQGNNIEVLKEFPDNYFGSVCCDPPYGLSFMGKKWDYDVPSVEFWQEVLRVLKPGGHILVFCGTKTQHRMVVNIEDAGFEIRDVISWLYGQGFPKSYSIANGIEGLLKNGSSNTKDYKKLEGTRKSKGGTFGIPSMTFRQGARPSDYSKDGQEYVVDVTYTTEEAQEWDGWGTALKPACEFITLARKPISEKTIAKNVLRWGVGGINIDESRIELNGEIVPINKLEDWSGFGQIERPDYIATENSKGRWPANVILDEEAGEILDEQTSYSGGASRFFYQPKPSNKEKDRGLEGLPLEESPGIYEFRVDASLDGKKTKPRKNFHPTVKPVELMKYLVKMITPFKEICLDPYLGSGTTGIACKELGIEFVGIELDEDYYKLATHRIENW